MTMYNVIYGIAEQDCSTISLYKDGPSGEYTGELQDLTSGVNYGSLEFILFLNADSSSEEITCPACWSGPSTPGCDIEEELN